VIPEKGVVFNQLVEGDQGGQQLTQFLEYNLGNKVRKLFMAVIYEFS
jgi:hypothetical protein